ncbi:hypothetical protein N431DRAFT_429865 [Stipitochalara longipes BDJ]|nr:hypothetical protein N431DRAFT_429865 [Stipitochalara longipes BDJ]
MPSLSKLILLSTLLLSGALSMPIASPGDGWHPSASTGSLGLHRTGKREAQPAGASDGGEGHHKRDVEELEARGDGWHPSASTGNLGLTRSGKREADPEARNTLETIPIAPAEFAKRGPSGAHGGGSGHHKREAEEAELDARGDGWHPSASTGNLGLTRSGKREAEEADLVARGDGWHPSANTGNLGLTRTGKRDAEEAELEARGDGWHPSANTGNLGLTRSGKRDSEEADLEARGDGWHPSASTGNLGLTRSGKREEAGEPFEIVAEEAVEKREAAPSGAHGGGSGHHKREAEEAEIEARGDGWHPSASTGNLGLTKSG